MKRICTALAVLLLSCFTFAAHASGLTITSPTRGVAVSTCDYDAQAICSVTWNGKQFINDYDHGRQLQSAASFDGRGENYNPTEAGSSIVHDGKNPSPSSSIVYNYSTLASPPTIKSVINMAYWNPVNGVKVSNWVHSKNVALYEGIYATYMKYDVQIGAYSQEPAHSTGTFEFLTGYMPTEFSRFYTLDVKGTQALTAISECPSGTVCSPEQPLPLIFATTNGSHAMGIYNRASPQADFPVAGYGRWRFPDTVKWNNVFRYSNIQPRVTYYYTSYVVVGTLTTVKLQMQHLYNSGL
ncbi:hypothetical protein [Hyalangium sp.]|uniref:hypothetical protein n=1 Tax=Hyalangium sp. TaxID=2028555 RepID=UPI002D5F7BA6|nr:hypothetical protein [Hyalangium sp.]HYH95448.1 hypothetical protein [Hyalangium sp.]